MVEDTVARRISHTALGGRVTQDLDGHSTDGSHASGSIESSDLRLEYLG